MLPFPQVNQVALVVRDLDAALRRYWQRLGVGPWRVYTYGPPLVKQMTYRGRREDYRMRLAFAQTGATQLELIQPLTENNIYAEQLARKGEGLNHVGIFVPSLDAGIAEAEREGFSVLQSGRGYGRLGDGGFAYLDTESSVGMIVELIEVPKERVPPETTFPAS